MTERPLKVLHVIGGLQLGGAETLLYRLASRRSDLVTHEVICLGGRDWYSEPLEQAGVRVHHLAAGSVPSGLGRVPKLWRLLKSSGADVIQSWMYLSNAVAGAFGRLAGIPVVWGIHASSFDHLSRSSKLAAHVAGRVSGKLTDYVINCSSRSAEFHSDFGYGRVPGAVIHNGYDPEIYYPDEAARAKARAALEIGPETFVIGSIARWHAEKDVPNLLQALGRMNDQSGTCCLLIGPGLDGANQDLTTTARRHGSEGMIRPLGRRNDVVDLARAMDVHVLASRSEAFPNVVAETMLSGTPNIVTDVGDARVMTAATGWVVPPSEPGALAGALDQARTEFLTHPANWAARRDKARAAILERFSFKRMADAYEEVWRGVAERT